MASVFCMQQKGKSQKRSFVVHVRSLHTISSVSGCVLLWAREAEREVGCGDGDMEQSAPYRGRSILCVVSSPSCARFFSASCAGFMCMRMRVHMRLCIFSGREKINTQYFSPIGWWCCCCCALRGFACRKHNMQYIFYICVYSYVEREAERYAQSR